MNYLSFVLEFNWPNLDLPGIFEQIIKTNNQVFINFCSYILVPPTYRGKLYNFTYNAHDKHYLLQVCGHLRVAKDENEYVSFNLYRRFLKKFTGTLQWRHNERDGVSNHQPHDCLFTLLFRHRSKKTSKLRVTGLCEGNSLMTGYFRTNGQ